MPRPYHDLLSRSDLGTNRWCDWCHTSTHNTADCRSRTLYCKHCDRNGHRSRNCYHFDEHGNPRVTEAPSDASRGSHRDPRRAFEDERPASGHDRWPVRQATGAQDRSCEVRAPTMILKAFAHLDSRQQTTRNVSYPCEPQANHLQIGG